MIWALIIFTDFLVGFEKVPFLKSFFIYFSNFLIRALIIFTDFGGFWKSFIFEFVFRLFLVFFYYLFLGTDFFHWFWWVLKRLLWRPREAWELLKRLSWRGREFSWELIWMFLWMTTRKSLMTLEFELLCPLFSIWWVMVPKSSSAVTWWAMVQCYFLIFKGFFVLFCMSLVWWYLCLFVW